MKIKCLLDDNNYVISYASIGNIIGATELELPNDLFEHFSENFGAYRCDNNVLYFDETKYGNIKEDEVKEELRARREQECFPIINRGKLWYDSLTSDNIAELDVWYKSWLDVTDTKIVPNRPEWLP